MNENANDNPIQNVPYIASSSLDFNGDNIGANSKGENFDGSDVETFFKDTGITSLRLYTLSLKPIYQKAMCFRGHSLPLASAGTISDGTVQALIKLINNRIFFVNQDNWVNPAFECAFSEALTVAQKIESLKA